MDLQRHPSPANNPVEISSLGLARSGIAPKFSLVQLPESAAVMILNTVLFPHAVLPLRIFEPRYRVMLDQALATHRMFVVAMQRPGCAKESPCPIAGLGLIRASVKQADGTSNLLLQGISRVKLTKVVHYKPYRVCRIQPLTSPEPNRLAAEALRMRILELAQQSLQEGYILPMEGLKQLVGDPSAVPDEQAFLNGLGRLDSLEQFVDLVGCMFLRGDPRSLQLLMNSVSVEERLRQLVQLLMGKTGRKKGQKNNL